MMIGTGTHLQGQQLVDRDLNCGSVRLVGLELAHGLALRLDLGLSCVCVRGGLVRRGMHAFTICSMTLRPSEMLQPAPD